MPQRRRFDRRTGLVLLALAVVSNFLPWMELAIGQTLTFEAVGPRELAPGLGMCLLAALLDTAAWLVGRRRPMPAEPRLVDPRRAGLRATLASCAVNTLLTAVILFLRTRETGGPVGEFGLFAFLWCLVALPVQIVAAFALGRASVHSPGRRGTTGAASAAST
jgi:hypothetical protein